jgi:hypothetical protein
MFSGTAQVSHQVSQYSFQFCVSTCACDYYGLETRLSFAVYSHIGHNLIRKGEKKA